MSLSIDEIKRIRNSMVSQSGEYFQLKEDNKNILIVQLCDQIIGKEEKKDSEKSRVEIEATDYMRLADK